MDLQDKTVSELNKFAKEKGIKGYSKYRKKQDLIKFISDNLVIDESENKDVKNKKFNSDYEEIDYSKSEEKLTEFAQKYYKKLEQYAIKLAQDNIPFSPELFNITNEFENELVDSLLEKSKSDKINPNTLNNELSSILNLIYNDVEKNNNSIPNNKLIDSYNNFCYGVKSKFKGELKERVKTTQINLNTRQNNILFAEVLPLIQWTKTTLEQLSNKAKDYTKIAIALMIVTGRRQSEIMATAKFTVVDQYHLNFIGQTKGTDYDVEGYKIPCLVDSQLIINAMQWLEMFDKRENIDFSSATSEDIKKVTKKAHNRFSRYLNEAIKDILPKYVKAENKDFWIIEQENGKSKNRATTHFCRQIYSQVAYEIFYHALKIPRKKHQILAEILGHDSSEGNARKASQNYDADIEITDYEEIKKLISY